MKKEFLEKEKRDVINYIEKQKQKHQQAANYIIIKEIWSELYGSSDSCSSNFKNVYSAFYISKNIYYDIIKLRVTGIYSKNLKKIFTSTGMHEKYFDGSQLLKISDDKDFSWWLEYFFHFYINDNKPDDKKIKDSFKKMDDEIVKDIRAVIEKEKRGIKIDTDVYMLLHYIKYNSIMGASSNKIETVLNTCKSIKFMDYAEGIIFNESMVYELQGLLEKQLDMIDVLLKYKKYSNDKKSRD